MHSSKNDDRRDLNRLENERAEKIQEDPAYDEVEDENDLSKDIEIKDGESGSTIEERGSNRSNDEIIDSDENSTEYEE